MPGKLIARSTVLPFVHRELGWRVKFFLARELRALEYSCLMYPLRGRIQISLARLNLARDMSREIWKVLFQGGHTRAERMSNQQRKKRKTIRRDCIRRHVCANHASFVHARQTGTGSNFTEFTERLRRKTLNLRDKNRADVIAD